MSRYGTSSAVRATFSRVALVLVLAASSLLLGACRIVDDPDDPRRENFVVLADRTKVLDDAGLAALLEVSEDGEYRFDGTSPILSEVRPGDVLIVGPSALTGYGALLKVESVTQGADGPTLTTSEAGLNDAFSSYHIAFDTTVTPEGDEFSLQQFGMTFPLRFDAGSGANAITMTGSLSVKPEVRITFLAMNDGFGLEELSLALHASEALNANIYGQGTVEFEQSVNLANIPYAPITITVPAVPFPLSFTPRVLIAAGLEGGITGAVEASALQEASFEAGIGFKDGEFGPFARHRNHFEFDNPYFGATAGVKAKAGIRLVLGLYGTMSGPHVGVDAYVQLSGSVDQVSEDLTCVTGVVNGGVSANVGFSLPGLPSYSGDLLDHSYRITGYDSCGGSASPAITWAKSIGRVGSYGDRARSVIEASDGTYVIAGPSGLFSGISAPNQSVWIERLDAIGNPIWHSVYSLGSAGGGNGPNDVRAIVEVEDGFIIVTSIQVLKIDWGGRFKWANRFSADHAFVMKSAVAAHDGGVIIAGNFDGVGKQYAWIMKLNANGAVQWSNNYSLGGFNRIRATPDGGYVAIGHDGAPVRDVLLTKINASGGVLWQRTYDNFHDRRGGQGIPAMYSATDEGVDVYVYPNGYMTFVASSSGAFPIPRPENPNTTNPGHSTVWMVDVTPNGQMYSGQTFVARVPEDGSYVLPAAIAIVGGQPVAVGRSAQSAADLGKSEQVMLINGSGSVSLLGPTGSRTTVLGGYLGSHIGSSPVFQTADGGFVMVGTTDMSGRDEMFVVKFGLNGNINLAWFGGGSSQHFINEDMKESDAMAQPFTAPITASRNQNVRAEAGPYYARWWKR
ncbi:MAG: hypothetical protein KF813_13150 [Trueperaceae bacterium]|nr:hypothetical protein [Trueperaceae bacterium]